MPSVPTSVHESGRVVAALGLMLVVVGLLVYLTEIVCWVAGIP